MRCYHRIVVILVLISFFLYLGTIVNKSDVTEPTAEEVWGYKDDQEGTQARSDGNEVEEEVPNEGENDALKYEEDVQEELEVIDFKKKMEEVESENSRRLERIVAVCRKYGLGLYKNAQQPSVIKHPPTPQYQVFFFDRVHKLSLCPIYKAGSTSWLYNLLLLAGVTDEEIEKSGKTLSILAREYYPELDPGAAEQELRSTIKVMTVRHPFERVLSAYRDKLENINHGWEHGTRHFYQAYGQKIVKKYRPGGNNTNALEFLSPADVLRAPTLPKPSGIEPTFQEFARFLIDSNLVSIADDHWIPYYLYCTPCLLNYEFIAKTETLGFDQTYVIRALGLSEKIKASWRHKTQFTGAGSTSEVSEVAKVYFHQLTSAQILQLFETYRIDFELFGYDLGPYLQYAKDASV